MYLYYEIFQLCLLNIESHRLFPDFKDYINYDGAGDMDSEFYGITMLPDGSGCSFMSDRYDTHLNVEVIDFNSPAHFKDCKYGIYDTRGMGLSSKYGNGDTHPDETHVFIKFYKFIEYFII